MKKQPNIPAQGLVHLQDGRVLPWEKAFPRDFAEQFRGVGPMKDVRAGDVNPIRRKV